MPQVDGYDPVPYWLGRADGLPTSSAPRFADQEAALRTILADLAWATVFELGSGGGRVTAILREIRPEAVYTALDVGPVQLAMTAATWPGAELVEGTIQGFDTGERTWDLVIAAEVLMHIPPADIEAVASKLQSMTARTLVTVDWVPRGTEVLDRRPAPWCFAHNYPRLFGQPAIARRIGRQVIHVWVP